MQRNWIGRSEGAEVAFPVLDPAGQPTGKQIEVFTTRPDTLFGATYLVLAPEHPLVGELTTRACREAVAAYVLAARHKSDLERTDLAQEKTGTFTGGYATNPVNAEKIPIWVADYVLVRYGTGAIMAVPAHDQRDCEFAATFGLPSRQVVRPAEAAVIEPDSAFSGDGINVNSDFLDGLPTPVAKETIMAWLEQRGAGKRGRQLPPARLGVLAPALLGRAHPRRALPDPRGGAGPRGAVAGTVAGGRALRPDRNG